jgi:23S rRNA pseudouridine1911/1915/1917 synthase
LPTESRTYLVSAIKSGLVSVKGRVITKPSEKIQEGVEISIYLPDKLKVSLEPVELPLEILFEDEDVMVINKPSGLSVHPGAGAPTVTLAHAIVAHVGRIDDSERPGIVHRLDKDTSGLLVIAKTRHSHTSLQKQFADKTAGREYVGVVVSGVKSKDPFRLKQEGTIALPIGRDPKNRKAFSVVSNGKMAITHFLTEEFFEFGLRVRFRLETGRTHQIRVHAKEVKAPLMGDPVYGNDNLVPPRIRSVIPKRQALHAETLRFLHPRSGKLLEFTSKIPEDIEILVETLRAV